MAGTKLGTKPLINGTKFCRSLDRASMFETYRSTPKAMRHNDLCSRLNVSVFHRHILDSKLAAKIVR